MRHWGRRQFGLITATIVAAHFVLPRPSQAVTVIGLTFVLLASVHLRARRGELGNPLGWYLMGIAGPISYVGVAVMVISGTDALEMPLLAHAFIIPGQLLSVVAFAAFVRARTRVLDHSQLLDLGIITLSFVIALKEAVLEPVINGNPQPGVSPTVTLAYALVSAASFCVIVRLATLPGRRPTSLRLLLTGIVASVLGSVVAHDGAWTAHSALITILFVLASVWSRDAHELSSPVTEPGGLGRLRLAGLALALVAIPVASTIGYARTDDFDVAWFLPPTVAVAALVMLRLRLVFVAEQEGRVALARSGEAHRALIEGISDVILVVDDDGMISYISESARSALGRDPRALGGQPLAVLASGADLGLLASALEAALDPGVSAPTLTIPVDGVRRVFEVRASDRRHDQAVDGVIFVLHDVTEQRSFQDLLRHQATHDSLTGLPNRSMLADHLERALAAGGEVTLLFVDLDDFKAVNDTLGHVTGDDLLRVVAQRLQGAVRGGDLVARLGGDEFAVVINEDDGPVGPLTMADRILRALEAPVTMAAQQFSIEASVGITSSAGCSVEDLLRQADIAMYQVKSSGKHGYAVYAESLTQ